MQNDVTPQGEVLVVGTLQADENTSLLGKTQQTSNQHSYPAVYISDHATVQLGDRYLTETHVYLGEANKDQSSVRKVDKSFEKRYKLLLASLAFLRMESRHLNISSAMPTTCDWLFGHEKYRDWMDDTNLNDHCGFLWIKGKPGTGKSTMMKVILEETKRKYVDHLTLSYFFNARASSELENSGLGLYRSVTHQLLEGLPQMRQIFVNQFSSKITEEEDLVIPWTSTELQEFIIECFRTPVSIRAFIFVDALDEGDQQDVRRMVSFLEDLTSHCTHSASGNLVRICFASRHYPLITVKRGISLVLEKEPAHADDIQKYINNKLIIDEDMVNSSLRLRIEEKSGQIFLWVILVIPILNGMHDNGSSRDDLLTHLETLPDELHELFEKVIFRDKTNISTTILLYQWLVFAAEPLGPEELYSAITINDRELMELEAEPKPATMDRYLLIWSRGLTEIVAHKNYLHQHRRTVQFIHETVREFLLAGKGLAALDENLEDNVVGKSHDVLRRCCQKQIDYFAHNRRLWKSAGSLSTPAFLKMRLTDYPSRYAISKYAVSYVFEHAGRAQHSGISQSDFLWYFDIQRDCIFTDFLRQCRDFNVSYKGGFPKGYYGGKSLLSVLLTQVHDAEVEDLILCLIEEKLGLDVEVPQYGNMLQAACVRGSTRIVRQLLDAGASVNEAGGRYENVLMAALRFGDGDMLNLVSTCTAPTSGRQLHLTLRYILKHAPSLSQVEKRVNLVLSRAGEARSELCELAQNLANFVDPRGEKAFSIYGPVDTRTNFRRLSNGNTSKLQDPRLKATQATPSIPVAVLTDENVQGSTLIPKADLSDHNGVDRWAELHDALERGRLDFAEMLLTVNLDLPPTFRYTGVSDFETMDEDHILCRAARGGNIKVVQVLLRNSEEMDAYRESAFRAAVIAGHVEVARLLQRRSLDHTSSTTNQTTEHDETENSASSQQRHLRNGLRASLSSIRRSFTTKGSPSRG